MTGKKMPLQAWDVLQWVMEHPAGQQREIAAGMGISLGLANKALKALSAEGWIDTDYAPTAKARALEAKSHPRRAVILAAGYGLRATPANRETPKGMIEIGGEPIAERTIRQLKEAGVEEITLVAGFMKEEYEYLADQAGVTVLFCGDYRDKNNLYSLAMAKDRLENCYIVPSDIYFFRNPFRRTELYSWYMLSKETVAEGDVRAKRDRSIVNVGEGESGNRIIGLSYLTKADAAEARKRLEEMTTGRKNSSAFWEAIVSDKKGMKIPARMAEPGDAAEINSWEQVEDLDFYRRQLPNELTEVIRGAFGVKAEEIGEIRTLKKGLSNRSFLFTVRGEEYIMRVPGEGTEHFIDRKNEAEVYEQIRGKGEDNVYFDPETGYKITRYLAGARTCDDENPAETARCMSLVRRLHEMKLRTGAKLDVFAEIEKYEALREGVPSRYRDYPQVKAAAMALRPFLEAHKGTETLVHGDCNPDNFLFHTDEKGREQTQLIDWEYAATGEPLTDVCAFILYHAHGDPKDYADRITDSYFPEGCGHETRLKVYALAALWALDTSNWCEYKMRLGAELGDFPLIQYRYAKAFIRIFEEERKADVQS